MHFLKHHIVKYAKLCQWQKASLIVKHKANSQVSQLTTKNYFAYINNDDSFSPFK